MESIKHHPVTSSYNPSTNFHTKLAESFKAILFTLTLEVKPRMVFLKLDNLAKIIHLAGAELNMLPPTLVINGYKLLLNSMSKAKLKMVANDIRPRVALCHSQGSIGTSEFTEKEAKLTPDLANEDELIYIGAGLVASALFRKNPDYCADISCHMSKTFALNIIKPKQ